MSRQSQTIHGRPCAWTILALLAGGPAWAEIDLRIEAWPRAAPIEAFVLVTEDGDPARGLTAEEFAITLDGQHVSRFELRLPAALDPAQNLSIVFVQADGRTMEQAIPAIQQMDAGDYAAAVRAAYMPGDPLPMLRVLPFVPTDGVTGTQALVDFLTPAWSDLAQLRYGSMVSHTEWLAAGLDQLESPTELPPGPKAIVLQGNGRFVNPQSPPTQSDLVARANGLGIPVFTLATADLNPSPASEAFMAGVADATGGRYLQGDGYPAIQSLLEDAYALVIPPEAVSDCDPHMLEVTVRGETMSASLDRCDGTPDAIVFEEQASVAGGSLVVSNTVAITGIDTPVEVAVSGGEYSLGCRAAFTTAPGIVMPDDLVCVRHAASQHVGALNETTLVVGGVGATFYSSTGAADPPSGGAGDVGDGGGGGAFGQVEILAILGMLLGLRRRWPRT